MMPKKPPMKVMSTLASLEEDVARLRARRFRCRLSTYDPNEETEPFETIEIKSNQSIHFIRREINFFNNNRFFNS